MVIHTYASVQPLAVMIKLVDAPVADVAMP